MAITKKPFTKGFYMTDYGNTAFVGSSTAKTAYDVDANEKVPIECVLLGKCIRPAKDRRS